MRKLLGWEKMRKRHKMKGEKIKERIWGGIEGKKK